MFFRLSLTEKALAATILSFNRKQRFQDNDIPEGIFNEIQRQVMEKALMGETILYTDSTHIKARANKHKKTTFVVGGRPKHIWKSWTRPSTGTARSWTRSSLTRRAPRKAANCARKAAGWLPLQRVPDRGQQAQHCGECTDYSDQCQRRRTHSRDTKGY